MIVVNGAASTWLSTDDVNYMNRMLKDLCSSYKTTRDYKDTKQGGNFNAIPHRLGDGIYSRFQGADWPYWYATVALNSPSTSGVGKRRLILEIRNKGDYGTVEGAIFSPTHYGDNPKSGTPDFVILTGLTLNLDVGFAYKAHPPTVTLPATTPVISTPVPATTPVVATGTPTTVSAEDNVPDFVKELRRQTGESFFTGTPDQFFRLQPPSL